MTSPLEQLLAKSKELREKATKGPWSWREDKGITARSDWSVAAGPSFMENGDNNLCFFTHLANNSEVKDRIIDMLIEALIYAQKQFDYAQHKTVDEFCIDELIAGKHMIRDSLLEANDLAKKALEK